MSIFPRRSEQYTYAQLSLNKYLDEYISDESWEMRTNVRRDVMARAMDGKKVNKKVTMRQVKEIEVTDRQILDTLSHLNSRKPMAQLSFTLISSIDVWLKPFNSGDIAYAMFGPSEKTWEKGKHEQNIKNKIRRLAEVNLIHLDKRKYYKCPIWAAFMRKLEEMIDEESVIIDTGPKIHLGGGGANDDAN